MQTGTIVRLVRDRGFGFIRDDADAKEYFFHHSAIVEGYWANVDQGDKCTFEIGMGPKGPRAEDIRLD